jgi:hypothetical protein
LLCQLLEALQVARIEANVKVSFFLDVLNDPGQLPQQPAAATMKRYGHRGWAAKGRFAGVCRRKEHEGMATASITEGAAR